MASHFEQDPHDLILNGATYRSALLAATDDAERLKIEMRGFSRGVIQDMAAFPADNRFFRIDLETISHERSMETLRNAFVHLGFRGAALSRCIEIARQHCLWNLSSLPPHATTGVDEQWQEHFSGSVLTEFRQLFGWPEEALGYL
jgi:hypothetical protein